MEVKDRKKVKEGRKYGSEKVFEGEGRRGEERRKEKGEESSEKEEEYERKIREGGREERTGVVELFRFDSYL